MVLFLRKQLFMDYILSEMCDRVMEEMYTDAERWSRTGFKTSDGRLDAPAAKLELLNED